MERMEDLEAFVAIVDEGSLTRASRVLGRSLHSVSRSLMTLERNMGVELVRRTTRQLYISDVGLLFYQRVKPAIAEISEARREAANRSVEPSGTLRVSAPVLFASTYLVPVIASFMSRYVQSGKQARSCQRRPGSSSIFSQPISNAIAYERDRHIDQTGPVYSPRAG